MDTLKVKTLIIDPWCLTYIREMANEMSKLVDVTLVTKFGAEGISEKVKLCNIFFKKSDSMNRTFNRKIIRWLEYVYAWIKILYLIHKERFDVIHVQWLLNYPTDIIFLKKIKKYASKHSIKLIYTAHNALPHVNGEKSIKSLKTIYKLFDTVIVHGKATAEEIQKYFPNYNLNFYIQKHGAILTTKNGIEVDKELITVDHYRKVTECKGKKLLLLGNIFYNKGFDRIMTYWCERENKLHDDLLVVAGKIIEAGEEYKAIEKRIEMLDNVVYYPRFISNDEHDFFFSNCDLVVLPYRHASMSGVIFSAAQFHKPVLTTNVGCIPDYIIDGDNAFLIENDDERIRQCLDEIIFSNSKERLAEMGDRLNSYISTTCSWRNVCEDLINEVYC